jgi:biotin carboxyl carrier protein
VEYETVLLEMGVAGRVSAPESAAVEGLPEGIVVLKAPMSGTLFHQASPGTPAFAPEGAEVESQATVAFVEVMKSLTPVRNAQRGRVVRWLVEDGEAVTAGQALVWIEVAPQ